jgi:hypothetical protein
MVRNVEQLGEPGLHPYRIGADHGRDPGDGVIVGGAEGAHLDEILRSG